MVGVAAVIGAGVATTSVGTASAAVPAFPDNIVVFPDRDFVSLEGYSELTGSTVTIEVSRPGVGIIGSTTGPMSAGDPPLEVNHPGGVCWGNGTGLKVTPDIQPGDKVTLKLGATNLGDTTAQDAYVSEVGGSAFELNGTTLTVHGHVGSSVNRAQFEQRIVAPDLKDTAVARRDIRATTPVLTPGARAGYSSMLEFPANAPGTFVATYVFDDAETAAIAASGQMRVLTWQEEDADANRQGLTIAEFGEAGGPGMGGCPNGPTQLGPSAPSNVTAVRSNDLRSITLTWTPAQSIPGTAAIEGYSVLAVGASAGIEQSLIGKKIGNSTVTGTTITGLDPAVDYTLELRSISASGETFPPATPHVVLPGTDTVAPTVSATPAGGGFALPPTVTLSASETNSEIYYSLTGVDLIVDGDTLSSDPSVTLYTGPFVVEASTTISFVAFDPSGNISDQGTQDFVITNDPVPAAPVLTVSGVARQAVSLSWTAPDAGGPNESIVGYELQVYTNQGAVIGAPIPLDAVTTSYTVTNLTGDTPYQFGLRAANEHGRSPESARVTAIPLGDVSANAGPDQTGIRRGTAVTLSGAGSTVAGATYAWSQVNGDPVTIGGASTINASFTFPLFSSFTPPIVTNPSATFQLAVTVGGVTLTDTVTITSQPDIVTISQARFKGGELRLAGTGTVPTATLRFRSAAGTIIPGSVTWTPGATPAAASTWELRIKPFNGANPVRVFVESNLGGTANVATTT